MSKNVFYILLLSITLLGFALRFKDYDKIPPFGNTMDELMYPWGGITFFQTGTPSSWTLFTTARKIEFITLWNNNFNIATPWVEKPPVYPLLTGAVSLLAGQKTFESIRLSTLRLIPLSLSFATIFFTGLFAYLIFNKNVGLIAALIYATAPTIAVTNRLSLTENLLTPISLFALWITLKNGGKALTQLKPYLLGVLSGLAILTRQLGVALPITIIFILMHRKKVKDSFIVFIIATAFGAIYPLIGFYYGWDIFIRVIKDYRQVYAIGLPVTIQNIFRFPMLMYQLEPFLDGTILAGYILIFSGPFIWIKERLELFSYPLIYLIILAITESGKDIFGWHLYPIFPFIAIVLAKLFLEVWENANVYNLGFLFLVLGSSSYRFLIQLIPPLETIWQKGFIFIMFTMILALCVKNKRYTKIFLATYFCLFLLINILIILDFGNIFSFITNVSQSP